MPSNLVPDRWEDYESCFDVVAGTPFFPFKTPLKEIICRRLSDKSKWMTPQQFLDICQHKQLRLALIIDLTFTSRYYEREFFLDNSVAHKKVFVEGQLIPSDDSVQKFKDAVLKLLNCYTKSTSLIPRKISTKLESTYNGPVIGVHCTHGLNRTGYLVCRFMIEEMGFEPNDAIAAFNVARGYDMERENYLEDLRNRVPRNNLKDLWPLIPKDFDIESLFQAYNDDIPDTVETNKSHTSNPRGTKRPHSQEEKGALDVDNKISRHFNSQEGYNSYGERHFSHGYSHRNNEQQNLTRNNDAKNFNYSYNRFHNPQSCPQNMQTFPYYDYYNQRFGGNCGRRF